MHGVFALCGGWSQLGFEGQLRNVGMHDREF